MVYLPHWPIPATLGKKQVDHETVFERMSIVLDRLNNPHQRMPAVIHVAGTNGKGSTSSLIAKIFQCSNYKVHLYTSPHLHHCNERIVLDGEKISDNFLYEIMEETRLASESINLTFMESFTIGAYLAFSKISADVVVLECGMGGRIDATNIVENKIATVITPISFDHTEYLGDTISKIALEKAMIIRPNVPLIVSDQCHEAKNILKIIAQDQNLESYFYDEDYTVRMDPVTKEFDYFFEDIFFENLAQPALCGNHQYINFATAITTALTLRNYKISQEAIRKAIKTVKWPSRLEKINNNLNQIFSNPACELWIDGAHNEGGAQCLAHWLEEQDNSLENFVICGFSRAKCKENFINKFQGIARLIAVRVNGEPYAEDPQTICKIAKKFDDQIQGFEDLIEALRYIALQSKDRAIRIVICGSLHLARDVKKFSKIYNKDFDIKITFRDF